MQKNKNPKVLIGLRNKLKPAWTILYNFISIYRKKHNKIQNKVCELQRNFTSIPAGHINVDSFLNEYKYEGYEGYIISVYTIHCIGSIFSHTL